MTTTELVHRGRNHLEPSSIGELVKLSEFVTKSGLVPRGVRTAADAYIVIATGLELGLSPMAALRSIYVVEGKPALSADLMAAAIMRSGLAEEWAFEVLTESEALLRVKRIGLEAQRVRWTVEDARRAGLTGKGPWKSYPRAMLRARAISEAARMVFPDVVAGLYTPEELSSSSDSVREEEVEEVVEARFEEAPGAAHRQGEEELPAPPAPPSPSAEETLARVRRYVEDHADAISGPFGILFGHAIELLEAHVEGVLEGDSAAAVQVARLLAREHANRRNDCPVNIAHRAGVVPARVILEAAAAHYYPPEEAAEVLEAVAAMAHDDREAFVAELLATPVRDRRAALRAGGREAAQ